MRKSALALFLIVLGGRSWWIGLGGSSLPLWDQWIGDFGLLTTLARHALDVSLLGTHHNEHLILGERLATLGLFSLSGRWEPRDGLALSALVRALGLVIAWRLLSPPEVALRRALLVLLTLLGSLPLGTFNLLSGFQIVFFLHESLLILALWWLAAKPLSLASVALGGLFLLLDFFNAASVFTTIAAATVILGLRTLIEKASARRSPALAFGYVLLFGIAAALATPTNSLFRARNLMEFMSEFLRLGAWPAPGFPFVALLSLAPPTLLVARLLRDRPGAGRSWFIAAVSLAGILQMAATAFARGRGRSSESGAPQYEDGLWFAHVATFLAVTELLRSPDGALTPPRLRLGLAWAVGLGLAMTLVAAGPGLRAVKSQHEVVATREARFAEALRSGEWGLFEDEHRGVAVNDHRFFSDPALRFRVPLGTIGVLKRDASALRLWLPAALTSDPPAPFTRAVQTALTLAPALLLPGLLVLIGALRGPVD